MPRKKKEPEAYKPTDRQKYVPLGKKRRGGNQRRYYHSSIYRAHQGADEARRRRFWLNFISPTPDFTPAPSGPGMDMTIETRQVRRRRERPWEDKPKRQLRKTR